MNRPQPAGSATVSQFQVIGGIRQDAGDCIVAVEPGGAVQQRKGALYVVTEPAGNPAVGGQACNLAGATLAHEYYADPAPSVTTSLNDALNKANNALIHYNRQVMAAGDPPAGLPRKIRVGLSAAIIRPGQLYLCQLKPGLILWVHQGSVAAFPRPAGWAATGPALNGDGEIVGNFYPAPALGTTPLVEADFAFRRFDSGDLLILCASVLAPLLDEAALTEALPGRTATEVTEYLYNLAQTAGLPEAHALIVEMSAAPLRRSSGAAMLPPPPPWTPDAAPSPAPLPEPPPEPPPAAPEPESDRRVIPLRPRSRMVFTPPAGQDSPPDAGTDGEIAAWAAPDEAADAAPDADLAAAPESEPEAAEPGRPSPARAAFSSLVSRARQAGQRAAPVVTQAGKATLDAAGTAGKATLGAAGTAGKATLGAAGTAGKATLGAAGNVLGATLPENVRQRGAAGILNPEGTFEIEEGEEELDDPGEEPGDPPAIESAVPGGIVDFDAPNRVHAPAAPPFPVMRWLVPIAVVALLGVLLFAVQGILSGQQTAKVDGLLAQAQQKEADGQQGTPADRRDHLLNALELVLKARDIDPRSAAVTRLTDRVQGELDTLNNVTRLTGLNLLLDFGNKTSAPAATTAPTADTGGLGSTAPLTSTPALAPLLAAPSPGDYFSQVIVQGDDAYLLDKGSGRLYRFKIATSQYTALLVPGTEVDRVGTAGDKVRVGKLLFITWRPTAEGGDLAALDDAHNAYIWTPATGAWQAFALGGAAKMESPRDLGSYDGNLYALWAMPGQISKWIAGSYDNPPLDWLSTAASNEVRSRSPVAMAIDGSIYLLLSDGRIITLAAGEIKSTFALPVWPQVASPLAIFTNENSHSLYVVEVADKRIIRVDKETGAVQGQLKAPADSTAFDGLRNIYVDEAAGKIYALSGKKLYSATLPPLPAAPGTPVPALPGAASTPGATTTP